MSNLKVISNCTDCAFHRVESDPDPDDWFCDDDVKVVCHKTPQPKNVMVAIRPYNVKKEATTPKWCPVNLMVNKAKG